MSSVPSRFLLPTWSLVRLNPQPGPRLWRSEAHILEVQRSRVAAEVERIFEAQPLAHFDRCRAFQFAPSSIDFELVFFVDSADYPDLMATRQAVILGVLRRFAQLGAQFAYPTQTTFTVAPDGTLVMPYAEPERA